VAKRDQQSLERLNLLGGRQFPQRPKVPFPYSPMLVPGLDQIVQDLGVKFDQLQELPGAVPGQPCPPGEGREARSGPAIAHLLELLRLFENASPIRSARRNSLPIDGCLVSPDQPDLTMAAADEGDRDCMVKIVTCRRLLMLSVFLAVISAQYPRQFAAPLDQLTSTAPGKGRP
jgi:hypothetical protein